MSYDHNVYVGNYFKCKIKGGKSSHKHWLMYETDEGTIRDATNGRAGFEDIKMLKGAHYIFPEFIPDSNKFAYVMMPGYTKLADVSRGDGDVKSVSTKIEHTAEMVQALKRVFDFEDMSIAFGAIVEVV
jgi:hypothetical protein